MNIKIIAEIGINHKGSYEIAKKLIDSALEAKCWGIKFQYRSLNNFYNSTNEIGDEIIFDELKRSNISLNELKRLRKYAQDKKLKVGISFFTLSDFKKIKKYDNKYDFYKIPSAEFSNYELIKEVSKTKKELLMSTGGHTFSQIKKNIKKYEFINNPVFLHCTSNYPTEIGNQNLDVIKELSKIKNIKVGYSSHDKQYEIVFLAAAYGAEYLERHITIDKLGDGLDDSSSSTLDEFKSISTVLNNYKEIKGDIKKQVNQGEIINLQNLGTSLYAVRDIDIGKNLSEKDFIVQAPRKGLTIDEYRNLKNKKILNGIKKGEPVNRFHFKKKLSFSENAQRYANFKNLSLPIRFHDMKKLYDELPINNYEFHLSYYDLKEIKKRKTIESINLDADYTFHLPDYLDKSTLINPISNDLKITKKSRALVEEIVSFTNNFDQDEILLISSISQNTFDDKEKFYKELSKYIRSLYEEYNVKLLPQWLPKKAWYFGGAFDTEVFSSSEDIKFIKKYNLDICLDISHLIMSANFYNEDWFEWYKKLKNNTKHMHLSDSYGINGEGVKFGKGELRNIEELLNTDAIKVLEIWQGHLNNFFGFKEAINFLEKRYN